MKVDFWDGKRHRKFWVEATDGDRSLGKLANGHVVYEDGDGPWAARRLIDFIEADSESAFFPNEFFDERGKWAGCEVEDERVWQKMEGEVIHLFLEYP